MRHLATKSVVVHALEQGRDEQLFTTRELQKKVITIILPPHRRRKDIELGRVITQQELFFLKVIVVCPKDDVGLMESIVFVFFEL